ncbi:MAG: amidohydrolase family protein [Beijerinckiaceae bacterium]
MVNRRDFMQSAAAAVGGICFVGCNIAGHDRALAQAPRRREVVVAGKRIKTIDIHAHCAFPEAMALMKKEVDYPALVMADARIQAMDEQGIDIEALSINPTWYDQGRDVAAQVIKLQNEKLAELCAAKSDRFVAFASVALQHPDLAIEQLELAIKRQGLRGVAVGGSVNGLEFSDPKFHPFWAKCEELGTLIFIHPQGTPELKNRVGGNGLLFNVIGNPLETTIALSHLIFEGTLDKYPGLKICAAHGGGYLGSYAPRSDHGCLVFPERCDANIKLKKKPTEYLRDLYYDNILFTTEAMRHLGAEVGNDKILLGTDYPYPWEKNAVDLILKTPGLTDAERAGMLGDTAAKLLKLA